MDSGAGVSAECVARHWNHAVKWPDTPKFKRIRPLGLVGSPETLAQARSCGPWTLNFPQVPHERDLARYIYLCSKLERGLPIAVPSGVRC